MASDDENDWLVQAGHRSKVSRPVMRPQKLHNSDNNTVTKENLTSVKGRTVLVQVQGTEEEKKTFVGKSLKLSRLLYDSEFGTAGIENVNVNFKRQSVTVILKNADKIQTLLTLNKLGDYKVECSQPLSHTKFCGVIKHIGFETTNEEVMEALNLRPEQKDITAQRIMKGKRTDLIPTLCMKLTFPTAKIPEYVYLTNQRFIVHPYIDTPYQCYNCQGFRHGAKDCKGKPKCVRCAGDHISADCPRTEDLEIKCINCGLNHAASYGGCLRMKREKQVERTKAHQGVTYSEALRIMKNQDKETLVDGNNNDIAVAPALAKMQRQTPKRILINQERNQQQRDFNLIDNAANFPQLQKQPTPGTSGRTRRKAPKRSNSQSSQDSIIQEIAPTTRTLPPPMKDAACQTSKEISTQTSYAQQPQEDLVTANEPFLAFLIETLVTTTQATDLGQKCAMATTAYRKHLGKVIDPNRLKQLMMNNDKTKQSSTTNSLSKQAPSILPKQPPPAMRQIHPEPNSKESSNHSNEQQ